MKKEMNEVYSKYDALICPSFATVANPIDRPFGRAYPGFGSPSTGVIPAGNMVGRVRAQRPHCAASDVA